MSVAPPEGGRNRIMIYGPKRFLALRLEFRRTGRFRRLCRLPE